MAVLCRTNGHMDKVAAALARVGILTSGSAAASCCRSARGRPLSFAYSCFADHDGRFIPRALSTLGYDIALTAALERLAGTLRESPLPYRFATFAAALRGLLPHFRGYSSRRCGMSGMLLQPPRHQGHPCFLRYLQEMSHLITVPEGNMRTGETGNDTQHQGP